MLKKRVFVGTGIKEPSCYAVRYPILEGDQGDGKSYLVLFDTPVLKKSTSAEVYDAAHWKCSGEAPSGTLSTASYGATFHHTLSQLPEPLLYSLFSVSYSRTRAANFRRPLC